MALMKTITNDLGITTEYHRICSINYVVNVCTILEITSYVNKSKREEEKFNNENNIISSNIYLQTEYITVPMSENVFTLDDAYAYLLTTEKYSNAILD